MSGMFVNADTSAVRPSTLVAEALVNGHDLHQVERRAKALGIPQDLARIVTAVGCRCREQAATTSSSSSEGDSSQRN